ncbi:MAG: hypothetical protein QM619_13910 [Micropruina sp.]|uniref:hypothetical protein n=1 Tax=Micropruina sp. TaxID=2737536 RepID=UPI0039E60161
MMEAMVTGPAASAVDRLRSADRLRRLADAEELHAIVELADAHQWSTEDEFDVVGERPVRIGADGSRLVGEFLPLEVAAATGRSVTSATWLIRDALSLQARHPYLWSAVVGGQLARYQAFQLVQLCAGYELTLDQVLAVDDRLKGKYGRIGWRRLMRLARGLIAQVAADKVEAATRKARADRYMKTAQVADDPVVSQVWARLDTSDAHQLEATISAIARSLKTQGDTDTLDIRRARALGILATPARALALLDGGDDQRYLPRTKVYLHLTPDMITGRSHQVAEAGTDAVATDDTADSFPAAAVARSETLGPVTRTQLAELFGTHRITITPVIHGGTEQPVDSYEIPNRVRESVTLRDGCEVFPYSSRAARALDLDHAHPYIPGVPAQTRPDNLGPLTRRVHRAKTAGRWRLRQPRGGTFWWTSPAGQRYRVSPKGTDDLHDWSPGERALVWVLDTRPDRRGQNPQETP